jgi:PleD family two-component response regulator
MSSKPQTLYEEDEKKRSRDLLRSVNLKPQAAGVHLEVLNLTRDWNRTRLLKKDSIQPMEQQQADSRPMLQNLSIRRALVVDDSMLMRHTVCRLPEKYGFDVESASNGLDALRMLSRFRAGVIFTDLEMPEMNGHQLIAFLKTKPENV